VSLDVRQVRERVIRPALRTLGPAYMGEAAELLLLGTAAAESDFRALAQYGGGPALGLWQMEPATYRDHWAWMRGASSDLGARVVSLASRGSGIGNPPPAEEMTWNLALAAAMARVHYWRKPEPLPVSGDPRDLFRYYKQHYNTPLGKGTVEHFVAAWHRLVSPIL